MEKVRKVWSHRVVRIGLSNDLLGRAAEVPHEDASPCDDHDGNHGPWLPSACNVI
jgi:hypothetical protein